MKSTTAAIIKLTDHILKSFDERNFTIGVFLDLAKAFDTVNHTILLHKLQHYGIRNTALKWFHDYLQHRKQYTNFNNNLSTHSLITHSVPQGSLLGPLLFNIYINDLLKAPIFLKAILFADDSCFYLSGKNVTSLINYINVDLTNLNNWFISNKLTLNVNKSHYMIFSRKLVLQLNIPHICINNTQLEKVNNTVFLGILLQENLSWELQIKSIVKKLNQYCAVLYLTRDSLTKNALLLIYNSIIYSQLVYCNVIWARSSKIHVNKLFVAQKRVIRTITYKSRYAHTHNEFVNLKLLKVSEINKYFSSIFVYKSLNNLAYPLNYFSSSNQYEYNLRNNSNLNLPFVRSNQSQSSPSYYTCNIWNSLPQEIRNKPTLYSFRLSVKRYLLNQY